DRAEERGPEACDMEALDERSDEPEQQSVDHEDEQSEREQRRRQREQYQHRPDERVDEAQYERGDECRPDRVDRNRWHKVRQREKRYRIDQPYEQESHRSLSVLRQRAPSQNGLTAA